MNSTPDHEVKINDEYYMDVLQGLKPFELRKLDRDYKVGDVVGFLTEDGRFRRDYRAVITYILKDVPQFGLMEGFGILGLKRMHD